MRSARLLSLVLCGVGLGVSSQARADFGVVVAVPGQRAEAGAGAGGVVLRTAKAVWVLGADGALARRDDLARATPEGTHRLEGNAAAVVAYGDDGAKALVVLGASVVARPLPSGMRGAYDIMLDKNGTPALALVERKGWRVVIGPRGPIEMPPARSVPGVIPEVAVACGAMAPRAIGLDADGGLLVTATTCRRDAPTALLRWSRAGGDPSRTALPAALDLGGIVIDKNDLIVATKADDLGTFSAVGALRVSRDGKSPTTTSVPLLAIDAHGLEPPQLARAHDGTLYALARVKVTAERMGQALFRLESGPNGRWTRVSLPSPDGVGALVPERLILDGNGRVFLLARPERFEVEGRWLLGETEGRPAREVPAP